MAMAVIREVRESAISRRLVSRVHDLANEREDRKGVHGLFVRIHALERNVINITVEAIMYRRLFDYTVDSE